MTTRVAMEHRGNVDMGDGRWARTDWRGGTLDGGRTRRSEGGRRAEGNREGSWGWGRWMAEEES